MDNSSSAHSEISTSQETSSATSAATSPEAFTPAIQATLGLSHQAVDIISNISNYVALGCLCFEDFTVVEHDVPGKWQDITNVPIFPFDTAIGSLVAHLYQNGWIRLQSSRSAISPRWMILRIYLLFNDIGNGSIDRSNKKLIAAVQGLLPSLDTSQETWAGHFTPGQESTFDIFASRDGDDPSLFYVFNRLPSPAPRLANVKGKYEREALEDLLDPSLAPPGLKTTLYPYQRRSAGAMLQRELALKMELDPRLEKRKAPDDSFFYYAPRDVEFFKDPKYCENIKGGILAESMGLGKTLICLSLILATKDQLPKIPIEYAAPPVRSSVASLVDTCISTINRKSVPWKIEFERIRAATGHEMTNCTQKLLENPPIYFTEKEPQRWNRTTTQPPPQRMVMAATTLIVVPQNLCKQWQSEVLKHVEDETLNVLVLDDRKKVLPIPEELSKFDVILFTRNRFDLEVKDGEDSEGRRLAKFSTVCRCPYIGASRKRDCRCVKEDMLYESPLRSVHFKRLIVDEGHFFNNSSTNTISVINKLITADARWSVSGTPARDLLGVEVDTSLSSDCSRDDLLEERRRFNIKEDKSGAIDSVGSLASFFLRAEPWSRAKFKDHVFRHEDLRRPTFSGFSTCLQRTLQTLVIKTRPEDVEKDIQLPPLHHTIVRLEPSFYDKLSANLFTLVLTANAVTSERTDADYLFHRNSHKSRYQLVGNLRQSAFFWTGFSEEDVHASIKNSEGYLSKEETGCSAKDRQLLQDCLKCTNDILASPGWKAMGRSHELGVFVQDWPDDSAEHWAFDDSQAPLLTGISQCLEAQKFVNERLAEKFPEEGLSGVGIKALAPIRTNVKAKDEQQGNVQAEVDKNSKTEKPILTQGIPTSSIHGEPLLRKRSLSTSKGSGAPPGKRATTAKNSVLGFRVTKARQEKTPKRQPDSTQPKSLSGSSSAPDSASDASAAEARASAEARLETAETLPPDSAYAKAHVVGTTSAKMSYLISQILKYYKDEKILVFYQGDNIAYYIAQVLDLLDIKHEIYAKSLQQRLKAEYVVNFDQGTETRVLLMDVGQAAFGLNLSSASRCYFVNPICRPTIEAQAIKRAHRIGQEREVFVETLVLKDTIEEKMLERSSRMTKDEHREASHLEDDGGIREIIQSARILPLTETERSRNGQIAHIETPEKLWGRLPRNTRHGKRKRGSTLEDVTNQDFERIIMEDDEPQIVVKRQKMFVLQDEEADAGGSEPTWFRKTLTGPPNSLLPHMKSEALSASRSMMNAAGDVG